MGAVLALTGRIVDLAANLRSPTHLSGEDREQIRLLAEDVGSVRSALLAEGAPHLNARPCASRECSARHPVGDRDGKNGPAHEGSSYGRSTAQCFCTPALKWRSTPRIFVRDALTNVAHIQFALKGCLTAGLCYIIYNGVDWPGISTAVTTCFLTALSTIGSSRQKQVLRISASPMVGGFLVAMGSQIFILPYLDSIAGFTVLFVIVTAFASWLMTSSARLSYFGVQIAVAFYLIHLNSFAIEPSLFDSQRSCRRHLARVDHDVARLRSTMGSIRRSQT